MEYKSKRYSSKEVIAKSKNKKTGIVLSEKQKKALYITIYTVLAIIAVIWVLAAIGLLIAAFSQELTYDIQRFFKINFRYYFNLGGNSVIAIFLSTIALISSFLYLEKHEKDKSTKK